jgi:hypothetical protein
MFTSEELLEISNTIISDIENDIIKEMPEMADLKIETELHYLYRKSLIQDFQFKNMQKNNIINHPDIWTHDMWIKYKTK